MLIEGLGRVEVGKDLVDAAAKALQVDLKLGPDRVR